MKPKTAALVLAAAVFAAGCNSFSVSQSNIFLDDDGNVLNVSYGQLSKERKTVFKSPMPGDGREFTTNSKLAVEVTLPEPSGDTVMMYQCMNLLPSGTMYMSSDGKWLYHANGFSCALYLVNEDRTDYLSVYTGILCERPVRGNPK